MSGVLVSLRRLNNWSHAYSETVLVANIIDWKDCSETSTYVFLAVFPQKNYGPYNFRLYLLKNSECVY